jgi:poly(beta-D-mannuronate) lyase
MAMVAAGWLWVALPPAPAFAQLGGYYRIMARHSGKALTVQSASTANSANVFQWTYGGSQTNDEWEVRDIGGGYFRVINRHSSKDMVVQSASTAEGANIFQYAYGGATTNDEWALVDVGSGYHRITNRNSGKSAEVEGAGTADGANVAQRTYSGTVHQQWQLVSLGGSTPTPPGPTPTPTATSPGPTPTPTATPTSPPTGGCARTVNVSTSSQLSSAASGAQPGDCIVAADGSYSAFTVTADGTSSSPIVIRAANRGGATISSGITRLNGANWVTIDGFRITSGGGSTTLDGETRSVIVSLAGSNNCRITRCNFKPSGHGNGTGYVMLNGNSNNNRVDHNDFGPNTVDGVHYVWPTGSRQNRPTLSRAQWANGEGPFNPNMARDTRVDHNYFHDMASGTAECIVLGGLGMTADYETLRTVVEYNLFTNCDGDPEIVSIKSSGNIVRFNTLRTSAGGFVSRAGNANQIYGNFVFGGGKGGSHGVRLHEMDHTVYNNYIENTGDYPINIASGHSYSDSSFTHAQVKRARVVHNTVVGITSRPVIFGWGNSGTRTLAPLDSVFANNILVGSGTLTSFPNPGNMIFANNIYSGNLGSSRAQSQFWGVNPQLVSSGGVQRLSASSPAVGYANTSYYSFITDDMDGQGRSDPDAGADEYSTGGVLRRPLTTADVGVNAP